MTDLNISNGVRSLCIVANSLWNGWVLCLQQCLNLLYKSSRSARLSSACRSVRRYTNENEHRMGDHALNRSSRALTYPRLGPLFLRTSSYAQSWPSLVQVAHRGLLPSHLNFLFLHIIHAKRFGLGTSALFGGYDVLLACPSVRFTCTVTLSLISRTPSIAVSVSGEDIVPNRAVGRKGGATKV